MPHKAIRSTITHIHMLLYAYLLTAVLSACQFMPSEAAKATQTATRSKQTSTLKSPSPTITSTAMPASQTPLPDPLKLTLPPAGPGLVSAWRPPLYPVPWALTQYDHFYFIRPIAANAVNWPLSAYRYGGTNFAPNLPHTGVDIVSPTGTEVQAAGPGTVVWTGYGLYLGYVDTEDPYGLAIAIQHDFGYQGQPLFSIYAHLSEIKVRRGQHVDTQQVIALSGNTGRTTASHLHFEVRLGKNDFFHTFNPELWMSPPHGWGILTGHVANSNGALISLQQIRIASLDQPWTRWVYTYGTTQTINRDAYYNENFVLSDIPAGRYEVKLLYEEQEFSTLVTIFPGAVTHFNFRGDRGINTDLPAINLPGNIASPTFTPRPTRTPTPSAYPTDTITPSPTITVTPPPSSTAFP